MSAEEFAKLALKYPDFDVGVELENCRNITTWKSTYVSEVGALDNRLRLKREDRAGKGKTNGRNNANSAGGASKPGPFAAYV